jgi:hypothetical protein
MKKFLDYKFILLLSLSLIVYLLYREIELISKRLNNMEKNINNLITYKPIHENLDAINSFPELNMVDNYSIKSSDSNSILKYEDDNITQNDVEQIIMGAINHTPITEFNMNPVLSENNYSDNIMNTTDDDIENTADDISIINNTLEEFSNEITEEVPIYSNDNEDDNHTSIIESLEDMTRNIKIDYSIDTLLKNKLKELQEIAQTLNISINHNDNNKRKTKLQLAQEIISGKKISKI